MFFFILEDIKYMGLTTPKYIEKILEKCCRKCGRIHWMTIQKNVMANISRANFVSIFYYLFLICKQVDCNRTHHFSNFVVHICTQIVYENHEETVHVHTGIVCATIVFPVRTLLGAVRFQSICKKSGYLFPTAILLKINFI